MTESAHQAPPYPTIYMDRAASAPSTVVLAGQRAQALEVGRTRLLVTGIVFALAFFAIGWRLIDLAVSGHGARARLATADGTAPATTLRADIVDRNGALLATSVSAASLYADPREIPDPRAAADALIRVLPALSHGELLTKLASRRRFVWLKRNLTPREEYAVNRLGIPGLHFRRAPRRIYPYGELTAHAVGFTDIDGSGLSGIERAFDSALRGADMPLALSLDVRVQHVVAAEMAAAMEKFDAVGGAGLVLDVRTGELLAMVSLPTFDPNRRDKASPDALFNRASLGVYEMGSVFKIFTTAMALDAGVVDLADGYDTSEPIREARYTITDFKPKKRWLSVPEIFMYSSNIGTARMALKAGGPMQRVFLERIGLSEPATLEIPEVGRPMLPTPWRRINTITASYGQGIAVSPLQIVSATAAVVNGGELHPATLLRRADGAPPAARRVIAPATSRAMRLLMRLVVSHGTGRKAAAPGYLVGGKTGTADKPMNGGYARDKRIASFAAAFPMTDPRYAVFIMLDEPKGIKSTYGYATGGWVAAPVVARVVDRIGPLLGVEPVRDQRGFDTRERLLIQTSARARQVAAN